MSMRVILRLINNFGTQTFTLTADPGNIHEYLDMSDDVFEFHMLYGKKYGKHQYIDVYLVSDVCPLNLAIKIKRYIRDL